MRLHLLLLLSIVSLCAADLTLNATDTVTESTTVKYNDLTTVQTGNEYEQQSSTSSAGVRDSTERITTTAIPLNQDFKNALSTDLESNSSYPSSTTLSESFEKKQHEIVDAKLKFKTPKKKFKLPYKEENVDIEGHLNSDVKNTLFATTSNSKIQHNDKLQKTTTMPTSEKFNLETTEEYSTTIFSENFNEMSTEQSVTDITTRDSAEKIETLSKEEQPASSSTIAPQQLTSSTRADDDIKDDTTMSEPQTRPGSETTQPTFTDTTTNHQEINVATEKTMEQEEISTVAQRGRNFDQSSVMEKTETPIEITTINAQDSSLMTTDITDTTNDKDIELLTSTTTISYIDVNNSSDNDNLSNTLYDQQQDQTTKLATESSKSETTYTNTDVDSFTEIDKDSSPESVDLHRSRERTPKQMNIDERQCPCDDRKFAFDPKKCFGERTVSDPSCPCRRICAKKNGDPCNDSKTCDEEFGLHCNSETKTCQGQLNIKIFDVTHNSAKIKWGVEKSELHSQTTLSYTTAYRASHTQWIEVESPQPVTVLENLVPNTYYYIKVEEDGKQEIGVFRTQEGCIFNATLSYAIGEKFNLSCNQTCICYPGGEPECHDRCYYVPTDLPHPSCIEVPDENDPCCVRLQCTDSIAGNPPKVLVTQRSPSTFTVVWDDFRLPSHHSEYMLEYRMAEVENHTWTKVQVGSQPIVTVTHLKPNTPYQVRVAVWEDGSRKLELPSEIVTVHTEDGCVKENKTYAVGDEFFYGCDSRCICEGNDHESCSPRCNSPYVTVGAKPEDPLCYEKPLSSDPCCVMIRCTEGKSIDINEDATTDKPGECPEILEELQSNAKSCLADCDYDWDCSGSLKCCPSSCGGAVCIQPLIAENICENIYCGPNAKCVAEKMSCECSDGYEGNPHDFLNGCKLSNSTRNASLSDEGSISVNTSYVKDDDVRSQAVTEFSTTSSTSVITSDNELEKHDDESDSKITTEAPFEIDLASKSFDPSQKVSDAFSTKNIDLVNSLTTEVPHAADDIIKTDMRETSDSEPRSHDVHEEDDVINITDDGKHDNSKESNKKQSSDIPVFFDGCEYNNITYDRGVRFEDGCEARCICDGPGHVSCVPRCSVLSSGGQNCKEIPDPDDNCCKIMVCSFPGNEEMEKSDELLLKILSAQPQNGTAVRIRLALSSSKLPVKVGQETLEIYFRVTSEDSNLSQWNKRPVLLKELMEIQQNVFEFDVGGLMPDTDYYFKVAKESQGTTKLQMAEFSNTVNAKTFPAAVKSVVQGCFHHNQSYGLGEMFFQGCELKCICREKGFIECQDRCEIYIDTVGYEGCDWIPSEEDPCCMVPSCQRRKIPLLPDSQMPPFIGSLENMCVVNSNEVYRVGDLWELDDGCKTKICRCSMLANGSTAIQCQSECPALMPNAHIPTPHCPHPILIKPDGPCNCPYISCNEPPRRIIPPPKPQCEFKGKRYDMGKEFHDGCIALCHCGQDLRVNCAAIECPYHFSAEYTNCLEWDIDPDFFPTPPHCCAPSKCKNDGSCTFSGQKFGNFEDIPAELLPCGTRCICVNGNVTCENRCPSVEDVPPANLPCPPSLAYKAHPVGDNCCLQWMCREPPKQAYCMFQGTRYLLSEQWEVRKGSQRRLCSCDLSSNGLPEVECKGGCPQIPQRFLLPSEQCARPVIVTPDDPVMCPYVVCNNTVTAQELYNVNVVALNSTAVRVRFTLANILVGLVGHAELHFTTDPTLPPSEWHIQKFSRPKRLFDSPNIEYILNALRPNTTYFLQVKIKIDALQGGPESELFKLRMPEEIVLTTTTTLPPVIMIDAKPEAHVIDANTARISWRNFEPQEKKFIYAVQLKYKLESEADDKWITTPMIHRDVTSYFLHDLEPSAAYIVDLIFTAPKELPTKLVSAKSIEFRTAGKQKDDYNLHVSVDKNKLDSSSTELSLSGIPDPINKYVHVVKILYKTPDGNQLYSFKVPKSNNIELDHLEPGKKYLAQMELYLTNGHTLTSNEVEFITKDAKPSAAISSEKNTIDETHNNGKQAELLQSKEVKDDENRAYFIALVVVAVVAAVAGFGFILLLVLLVRRQASAKAPISRTPSESAYDNPTYKTYDGERLEEKTNGQAIQTTQA